MLSEPNEWTAADTDPEDVRIAFTFNSKSLYQSLTKQIERFYRHFTDEPLSEATATLDIIHAWGGRRTGDGIYYILARQIPDVSFHTFRQAGDAFPDSEDRMEAVASEVRETGNIPQIWDAILIDEAQDFGPEFFNMCLEATTSQNRLIWAYDEAQDLSSLTAPSPKNIFGTDDSGDPILDLSGQYRGGPQKTYVMRKSYRAPRSILMLAHAVGMGLKRKDGPLQAITRQSGWENLGYEIDADFRKIGSEAILRRPEKNSPHPIQNELQPSDLITHRSFASKSDELEYVAEQVRADVEKEGLKPEQVLVIPLSRSRRNGDSNRDYISEKLAEQLERHDITINAVWEENDKNFLNQGEVTLAGINRAKGNEAGSVYVLGVDAVSEEIWRDNEVHRRNELFVALTRSRGWISATGATPSSPIHTEFDSVIQDIDSTEPHISFEVPDSRDLSNELETDTEDLERTSLDEFV
jgi:superfamily I DNA and RNA helicase